MLSADDVRHKWGVLERYVREALSKTAGADGFISPIEPSHDIIDAILSEHHGCKTGMHPGWKLIPLGNGILYSWPEEFNAVR